MSKMRPENGPVQSEDHASSDIVVAYATILMPSREDPSVTEDLSVMYGIPDPAKNGEEGPAGIEVGRRYPLIHLTPLVSGRAVVMHTWEGEEYQRDAARFYIKNLIENHGCVRGLIRADMSRTALTTRTIRPDGTLDIPYHHAHDMRLKRQRESMKERHPRSTETSKAKYNSYTLHESEQIKREVMATWEKVKEAWAKTTTAA